MPLDQQSRTALDEMASQGLPPSHTLTPQEARANSDVKREPGPEVARVEDRLIPGPGGPIPVRIYTPGEGNPPVLVWFHGGGWVLGSLDTVDGTCRRLAKGANCAVVSVDYRLAPEAKFPAAAEDCYAATSWVASNAASLNADPARVAVGGDSAGGNLAAVTALMARDKGGPSLVFQLMVYPVIQRKFDTKSYLDNADGYRLTRQGMIWFWNHYLSDESEATNPYAAPIQAKDLAGLPPALIITAEFDPLRDEGEAYATRLQEAGVPTACTRYDGTIHLFFSMPSAIDKGRQAVEQACSALKAAFARQPSVPSPRA